ncbi:hypothetical protein KAU43_04270 [candidate division WOR-3 bacterium]|nr:hypothetical protein [candidate division WOR-3 bacterium]
MNKNQKYWAITLLIAIPINMIVGSFIPNWIITIIIQFIISLSIALMVSWFIWHRKIEVQDQSEEQKGEL